jgi:hypothetical protein
MSLSLLSCWRLIGPKNKKDTASVIRLFTSVGGINADVPSFDNNFITEYSKKREGKPIGFPSRLLSAAGLRHSYFD